MIGLKLDKRLLNSDVYNCEDEYKPCKNGGKCIEYDPNFSCQCNVGKLEGTQTYFGGLCEEGETIKNILTKTVTCEM